MKQGSREPVLTGTPSSDGGAQSPPDRDESPETPTNDNQRAHNRAPIRQAHADVEAGVQDTERIGTPSDVPSKADNGRDR